MAWTPGRRKTKRALETPFEGVPDHLGVPLWTWVLRFLSEDADLVTSIGIEFRMALPDARNGYQAHGAAIERLRKQAIEDGDFLLDLVEYVLEQRCINTIFRSDWQSAQALEHHLELANSAYKVRDDNGGLELRTIREVQAQVQSVVNAAAGSAGEHLANAWNSAYSRSADPVKAYSESIKAVEAALAQHISPQNAKQTLGTMIRDVTAKPSKWKFTLADGGVETVLAMMRLLWDGQTSRHGGLHPTRNESIEEAQTAVHLAAALVQYGVSGALSPV